MVQKAKFAKKQSDLGSKVFWGANCVPGSKMCRVKCCGEQRVARDKLFWGEKCLSAICVYTVYVAENIIIASVS